MQATPENQNVLLAIIGATTTVIVAFVPVIVALIQRGRKEARDASREIHTVVNGNNAALQQRLEEANRTIADLSRQLPPKDDA